MGLSTFEVTDLVDDVLAAQYNLLLGSIVRGNFSNTESLTGTKTLTDNDFAYQVLNCNGANRDVNLPAPAEGNHSFYVCNVIASVYVISVKNSAGTLLSILRPGENKLFVSNAVAYRLFQQRNFNGYQGQANNYVITPTVTSNNLNVALKTMAGNDPSAGDPIEIRVGNINVLITAALSVTMAAGTSWMNLGSAELATKLTDLFCFVGYNVTDGVTLAVGRRPEINMYSGWSTINTNENYAAISNITTAAAGDCYENIGRFCATLSAGAGYTWTVPTFTAANRINKPIYETGLLSFTPVFTNLTVGNGTLTGTYKFTGGSMDEYVTLVWGNTTSIAGSVSHTLPFSMNTALAAVVTGTLKLSDASPAASYVGIPQYGTAANLIGWRVVNVAGTYGSQDALSSAVPITWTTSDQMYEWIRAILPQG